MENKNNLKFSILAIILIIAFAICITPVTFQNDTFYTIKNGEYISQNGITMQDPFSWHEDLPYTYPHWAYDLATYLIYSVGGFVGIYISTIVLTAILGICIYAANYKISKNCLTSFILTIGVLYFMKGFIAARAQLVTFILFILTVFFIERFLETKQKRYALGLIIIPIIIANVHAAVWPFYFVLYMPYIAEYIISLLAMSITYLYNFKIKKLNKKILNEDSDEKLSALKEELLKVQNKAQEAEIKREKFKQNAYKLNVVKNDNVKWLIVIMIICVLTGLLTPINFEPYKHLVKLMSGNSTDFINEHQPLTLVKDVEFMSILAVYFAILIFTDTKIRLSDLFMIGGLLYLALKTKRQVSMFLLIATIALNRLVCSFFNKYDREGTGKMIKLILTIPGRIIIIAVILLFGFSILHGKIGNEFIDDHTYPVKAAEYIKENIDLENMRLYNEYNYGSYLLFEGIPVFIDSRCDLYTPEFNGDRDIFTDFINTNNIGTYYEETMEKYDITHVILQKSSRLNMFISRDSNYTELYSDNYFAVYQRGTSDE